MDAATRISIETLERHLLESNLPLAEEEHESLEVYHAVRLECFYALLHSTERAWTVRKLTKRHSTSMRNLTGFGSSDWIKLKLQMGLILH